MTFTWIVNQFAHHNLFPADEVKFSITSKLKDFDRNYKDCLTPNKMNHHCSDEALNKLLSCVYSSKNSTTSCSCAMFVSLYSTIVRHL